jgi:hypothetical protein
MASSQARRRPVSPMFTQSETAPMVQKLVLLATAPMIMPVTRDDAEYLQMNREFHVISLRPGRWRTPFLKRSAILVQSLGARNQSSFAANNGNQLPAR